MNLETGKCTESEGSTFHKFIEDFNYRVDGHLIVAVPKDYINSWDSGHKCEHEGCFKDGSVECHVPAEQDIELIEHLCQDHAYEVGYCTLCGSFWGGIESFDFNNPQMLCENCLDQLKTELGEYEAEEAEYYGEYY